MGASVEEVKLLGGWASPFSMRAMIAFNMKGIKYGFQDEVVWNKTELLLKCNPIYKKIPVLLHGDKAPICESLIIVQYIDEFWSGTSILPSDPYDRAIARFWAAFVDDKFIPPMRGILRAPTKEAQAEVAKQAISALHLLEEAFEKCSKGKAFFGGDNIGYLDIALGSYIGWLRATAKLTGIKFLDEAKTPNLLGWIDRFCAHEAVKEVMPGADQLIGFANTLMANLGAPPPITA